MEEDEDEEEDDDDYEDYEAQTHRIFAPCISCKTGLRHLRNRTATLARL